MLLRNYYDNFAITQETIEKKINKILIKDGSFKESKLKNIKYSIKT